MISNYTETLNEFIAQGGNIHKEKFDLLPTFTVGNQTYNLYDLFITRYGLREIGAETEELFSEYLSIKLDEINLRYSNKITMYIEQFNKLMDRTIELTREVNGSFENNQKDENYVNPVTTNNAKLQDFVTGERNGTNTATETYTQAYSWFKSNPELLKSALEIENIFYTALEDFNSLFMLVY